MVKNQPTMPTLPHTPLDALTVFYGADTYRSRAAYRAARQAAEKRTDVPAVVLRDEQLTPAAFHEALGSHTLFSTRPPVAVERLTAFTGASATAVAAVLRNSPAGVTVLVWEDGVPAANGIVWRALQAQAAVKHFPLLSEAEVLAWIGERVTESGRTMDASARRALVARCGVNLWFLASELDKLTLLGQGPITVADVDLVTPPSSDAEIFSVVRAIVHSEPVEALRLLTAGVLSGEDPRRMFFLVFRELAALLRVREQLDRGEAPTAWSLARDLHLPQRATEHLLRTARATTTAKLRALFDRGVVAYYHLNTGRAEADEVLETLVLARSA